MTADPNPNDLPAVLDQLQQADPDLLRSMLTAFVQALMSADADTACGAEFGTRSPDRVNQRNGYRHRDWDTRAGTIELAGDIALDAAADLVVTPALRPPSGHVGVGSGTDSPPGQGDVVQGTVELTVTAAVEAVTHRAAAAGRDRAGAGQGSEGRVVAAPARMRPGDDDLGGTHRTDPDLGGQLRRQLLDKTGQLLLVDLEFVGSVANR